MARKKKYVQPTRAELDKMTDDELYKAYKDHLKSPQWDEVCRIVKERDKVCCFCGRSDDEMTLKNGKVLSWQCHHIPQGYTMICEEPEVEAEYVHLYCSSCHRAGHQAPSNRGRFKITNTKDK